MNIGEKKQEEIKTIKERSLTLKLSNADVKRLFEKAGGAGLTVSELLENFIGDLVDGTYSNGSDERDYAGYWFDRCEFGDIAREWVGTKITFLQWLIANNAVNEVVDAWEIVQDYAGQEVLNDDETNDLVCALSTFSDIFGEDMTVEQVTKNSTFKSEMPKVMQWWNDLKRMQEAKEN